MHNRPRLSEGYLVYDIRVNDLFLRVTHSAVPFGLGRPSSSVMGRIFECPGHLSRVPPLNLTEVVSPPATTVSPHTSAAGTRICLHIESLGLYGYRRLCAAVSKCAMMHDGRQVIVPLI